MKQASRAQKIWLILSFRKAFVHLRVIPNNGHWFGHSCYGTGEEMYERIMGKCSISKR